MIGKCMESLAERTRARSDAITLLEHSVYEKADRTWLLGQIHFADFGRRAFPGPK